MADLSRVRCPQCKGVLSKGSDLSCVRCGARYPIVSGIPVMLPPGSHADGEQNLEIEKDFYENMFSGLKGLEDGHCIVYGHEKIYEFLDGVERGTLLEAGCGAGHHGVNLSRRGFEVTSIDLTVNGVKAARALAEHEQQDITYVCGDIKQLPFADKEFDVCFCSLVLHHFVRLDNLVRELSRVTRKYFIAFEVSALDPMSFVRFNVINPTIGISNISRNQRALFPGKLARTLRKNGFDAFVTEYADMHDYLGRAPRSMHARMILAYQTLLRVLPAKYSRNKFLLRASRLSA